MRQSYGTYTCGGKQKCLQGFGGQTEGMALFGTLSRRLKDDIKNNLDGLDSYGS